LKCFREEEYRVDKERERENLREQWDLLTEKLQRLEITKIIETEVDRKFKIEYEIKETRTEREQIEQALREIGNNSSKDKSGATLAKTIWKLDPKKEEIYVAVATLEPITTPLYKRSIIGLGEFQAIDFVRNSFREAYEHPKTINPRFSINFPSDKLTDDIISIGGPKFNEITRLFTKNSNLPVTFKLENEMAVMVVKSSMQEYKFQKMEAHIFVDYGLISKIPNHLSQKNSVLLIEGIHTYGVGGAGKMLTAPDNQKLIAEIKKSQSEYWQAIIKVTARHFDVFPELVDFRTVEKSHYFESNQ
jgi:hypothetical protein